MSIYYAYQSPESEIIIFGASDTLAFGGADTLAVLPVEDYESATTSQAIRAAGWIMEGGFDFNGTAPVTPTEKANLEALSEDEIDDIYSSIP